MIFEQVVDRQLGCASYLVGDAAAGVCAVVDPQVDVGRYLALAETHGVRIIQILETHTHADHVTGAVLLARETGASISGPDPLGSMASEQVVDGASWTLGAVELRAMASPGHRPEHTSFLVIDHRRAPDALAILAGDSLLVGDVARPDLAVATDQAAGDLARSLSEGVLRLDDHVEVWPGHTGASRCGSADLDGKLSTTVGIERRYNPAVAALDAGDFHEHITRGLPPRPVNADRIVALNRRGGRRDGVSFARSGVALAIAAMRRGVVLVDTRDAAAFDAAHAAGALWLPASRPGFVASLTDVVDDRNVLLLAPHADQRPLAVAMAATGSPRPSIAPADPGTWADAGHPVRGLQVLGPADVVPLLADDKVAILDARSASDWKRSGLPGSIAVAASAVIRGARPVPSDTPVVTVCASGTRARTLASALLSVGYRNVLTVAPGGVSQVGALLTASGV